ncbi:hypothetical protein VCHENC02_2151B, partial [Vibrio harveyi]
LLALGNQLAQLAYLEHLERYQIRGYPQPLRRNPEGSYLRSLAQRSACLTLVHLC